MCLWASSKEEYQPVSVFWAAVMGEGKSSRAWYLAVYLGI